ncbi:efflux RND transporter periplasmic adaptor subunit [Bacteroides sp. 214]|uniref:efflux RND transporter periplasmic adaptor subunit n=1 Tax=Bacteroides sp. 214 TaxID=2302935 RepID=UPI0013D402CE|nr:efflux RND transporter periplasmic adaptor subunit [Bacteroides sp. 214]NDW11622.1 efflux RND transporter periplasmic adaptor subunit [Bacteroides sp. 214]
MRKHILISLLICLLITSAACSGEKKAITEEEGVSTVLPDSKSEVTIATLKRQAFNHELVSNGKVAARNMADLRFQSAEVIASVWVKNGDRVVKGQKLAELDLFKLTNNLNQTKEALKSAQLELQDVLIGQGYRLEDQDKVPANIMELAKTRSGYDRNLAQYELAAREVQNATLTAPFDGIVANLFAKPHNVANTSEVFCSIIDNQGMEVDFTVLESELALIRNNDKVSVTPYSGMAESCSGQVVEINPVVDDKGMVKVKARINGNSKLFSGMNVRVSVFRSLDGQLVIPKSAVVLRSGKQVVFTYKDGKAHWNYVHTGLENATECTILEDSKDKLSEGDVIIISGNVNLAHESPVSVIEQ